MLTIYAAGNLLLKNDSLPLRIMPVLAKKFPGVKFIEFDPTENFPEEKELVILDTVVGIKDAVLIKDIAKFEMPTPYSLHDFDLGLTLKLMQKAGLLEKFAIIGIPPGISEKDAVRQASKLIKSILP